MSHIKNRYDDEEEEENNEENNINIDNYSIEDIMELLNLPDDPSENVINENTDRIITKMRSEGNHEYVIFFQEARDKILDHIDELDNEDNEDNEDNSQNKQYDETTQLGNWWKNEYPSQTNQTQTDKYTDRKHRVQVFEGKNKHFQMNRERLGINQNYSVPVVQDVLNPNLKNKTTRIISVDSQYRQNIFPYTHGDTSSATFNADYTFNLSDTLKNVISIKLYSIQIPTTWNTFEHSLGNTCMEYSNNTSAVPTTITIEPGNYDINGLINELNDKFILHNCDISASIAPSNTIHKKIQFSSTNQALEPTLTFYKEEGMIDSSGNSCGTGSKINQNLGWNLGFRREPDISGNIAITTNNNSRIADVPPDLYGPKYFMLVVDDYNNNHVNNGLVNMSDTESKLNLPNYYNKASKSVDNSLNINCPTPNTISKKTPFMIKSSPRQLTQAQLYTVNEIINNRNKNNNRVTGPTTGNVLAILPLRQINQLRPDPYTEFGPTIQTNERTYFGPVDIERLRVRLLDDKGNLVNLNGHDWSFSFIIEQLYQY